MKRKRTLIIIICLLILGLALAAFLYLRGPLRQETELPSPASVPGGQTDAEVTQPAHEGEAKPPEDPAPGKEGGGDAPQPAAPQAQESEKPYLGNDPLLQEHPKAPELSWIKDLEVPEWSGEAYILINEGQPFFETENMSPEPWELYYDLDEMGRCTLADAVAGPETMPKEKRGNISSVKPTGWQSSQYPQELVDGRSLYNRCHLIAFGLCGETANKYNLVTGTRYFNTRGINAFENMVIDYIRETGNHVRYRVTPVWKEGELICRGQVTEAWSIEDEGDGICFCVYSYNVQPGIYIDYMTGDNHLLEGENVPAQTEEPVRPEVKEPASPEETPRGLLEEDISGDFILNTKSKKIHSADCKSAQGMSEKNRREYSGSYNELIEQGYEPDPGCRPWEPAE